MKLTPHFSLREMTRNEYAIRNEINNEPSSEVLENLKTSANHLETIRAYFSAKSGKDTPIVVYSGYRSLELNTALGSSDDSAHITGLAVDFGVFGYTPDQVVKTIEEMREKGLIDYAYLTNEQRSGDVNNWVHIDFTIDNEIKDVVEVTVPTAEPIIEPPTRNPADWVTEHFSWREMTRSDTAVRLGLSNKPNAAERENIIYTAKQLEKIRAYASEKNGKDTGIIVTSCFRSQIVNARVGGSSSSAHRYGLAVDFDIVGYTSAQTANLLKEMRQKGLLSYDQNILEYPKLGAGAWVHVGFKHGGRGHRLQDLTANKVRGRTVYSAGLLA